MDWSQFIFVGEFSFWLFAVASLFTFGGVRRNARAQFALGLYSLAVGEAIPIMIQVWTGGVVNDSFLGTGFFGALLVFVGILLLLGSLVSLGRLRWVWVAAAVVVVLVVKIGILMQEVPGPD